MKDEIVNFRTNDGHICRFVWQDAHIVLILGDFRTIDQIIKNKAEVFIPFKKKFMARDDGKVTYESLRELDWADIEIEGESLADKPEYIRRTIIKNDGTVVFDTIKRPVVDPEDRRIVPQSVKKYLNTYFSMLAFT